MRKEGFVRGDKVIILSDYNPSMWKGMSGRNGKEGTFLSYIGSHPNGYQYKVLVEGDEVTVWDIEGLQPTKTTPEYVECLKDSFNEFTKGKIYKIKRDNGHYWDIELDDKGSTTNGWGKDNFIPSTKEEYEKQQQNINMEEKINIGMERLVEYYNASTTEQKDYLNDNFKLNGDCTKKALIGLRDMACSTWKPKIEANHPEVFKVETNWEDKWVQPLTTSFFHIEHNSTLGLSSSSSHPGSNRKPRHAFKTREQAELMTEKCKLMIEMQNFAAVHNEGWIPDFSDSYSKYGIGVFGSDIEILNLYSINRFTFGISVKTREIAEKMLEEFGERIKKYYNEQY